MAERGPKRPDHDAILGAGLLRLVRGRSASLAYDELIIPRALLRYLSSLTVSQGRLAGQPFTVLHWQGRFVRGAFAPGVQAAALANGGGRHVRAVLGLEEGAGLL